MDIGSLGKKVFSVCTGMLESHFATVRQNIFSHTALADEGLIYFFTDRIDETSPFMSWYIRRFGAFPSSNHFQIGGAETAVIIIGWVIVWALLSRFHPQGQFWHDALAGTRLVTSLPLSR